MPVFESSRDIIADDLKPHDHWVLWGMDAEARKRLLAPWQRGDLYPVRWGSDAPERPETNFHTALEYFQQRGLYSAPEGIDNQAVKPAPMLLHDPLDPPLMLVDFDDVRDAETGEVSDEVADIVDRLGAYTEISQSGEGLHAYVRAELPGDLGKFIAPLVDEGDIELYDHGRAVGATWAHVDGTPTDVPEAQEVVDTIVADYETPNQRKRRLGTKARSTATNPGIDISGSPSQSSSDGRSPYYDIKIERVADTGYFSRHRRGTEGPHPAHGPIHSDADECTNFGIVPTQNVWFCFAHESGGRAIELAAILCDETDIDCDDVPRRSASDGWLRQQPHELLKTCLWLRDHGAVTDDATPPYDALLAVADLADLHIRDEQAGILGDANAKIAESVYADLGVENF
jgi:hypothetical protein